ncbi:MAG: hypothetical protein KAJ48_10695 [Elusimicrobiales bacterium]|nr:hypothetical protein [Elusimicrobiales bacterium]
MFTKFIYTNEQIERYYDAAKRDLQIAQDSRRSEIKFRFCYDAIVKLAITLCAVNSLRVKSRRGHHIALIAKLSRYLNDKQIEKTADNMRNKRNHDLYDGGRIFSDKEAAEYLRCGEDVFSKAESYLKKKLNKML